jgi:hypothetical protein
VKIRGNVVCLIFNGGWNFPGVEYIWKRIHSEITTSAGDAESESYEPLLSLFLALSHITISLPLM